MTAPSQGCAFADCGRPFSAKVHQVRNPVFEHMYIGFVTADLKSKRAKAPRLCRSCAAGTHDGSRTEYGCIEQVTPEKPDSYICSCELCKRTPAVRTTKGRSDSEGVIQCRF